MIWLWLSSLQDGFRHLCSVYFLILVIVYATSRAEFGWQQLDSTAPQSSRALQVGRREDGAASSLCAGLS
jgi:hypothetical protein